MTSRPRRGRPAGKKRAPKRPPLNLKPAAGEFAVLNSARDGFEALLLAAVRAQGLAAGGYVPKGGPPPAIGLLPSSSEYPDQALKWNVRGSDASLLLRPRCGLTRRLQLSIDWCRRYRKPWLLLDEDAIDSPQLQTWLRTLPLRTLHVTGPLAHQCTQAKALATQLGAALAAGRR